MTAELATKNKALARCEAVIEKGLTNFFEVGAALMEIRDEKLYKDSYRSFEAYCRERWKFGRHRGFQLILASTVVADLVTTVNTPMPTSERQTRPLAPLPPEQRREVWEQATAEAGGQPSPLDVAEIAKQVVAGSEELDRLEASKRLQEKLEQRKEEREAKSAARQRLVNLASYGKHQRAALRAVRGWPEWGPLAEAAEQALAALAEVERGGA